MSHDFAKNGERAKGNKAKKPASKASKSGKKPVKKKSQQAKKVTAAAAPKRLIPAWLWFLAGVLSTVSVQVFYHLSQVDVSGTTVVEEKDEAGFDQLIEEVSNNQTPEIRFYDELKHRQVEVSGEKVPEREQEDYNYALQAGSFKNKNDAEQLRAEITLLSLSASIESRQNDAGTLWHRVIVGPFTSRSSLASARSKLINNGIKTIRIKRG